MLVPTGDRAPYAGHGGGSGGLVTDAGSGFGGMRGGIEVANCMLIW